MGLSRESLIKVNGADAVVEYEQQKAKRALQAEKGAERTNGLIDEARGKGYSYLEPDTWRRIKDTGEVPVMNEGISLLERVKRSLGGGAVEKSDVSPAQLAQSDQLDQEPAPLPRRKPSQE